MKWEIEMYYGGSRWGTIGAVEAETIEAATRQLGFDKVSEGGWLTSDSFYFLNPKEEKKGFEHFRARGDIVYWVNGVSFRLRPQMNNLLDKDSLFEIVQSQGFAIFQGKEKTIHGHCGHEVEVGYKPDYRPLSDEEKALCRE